MEYVRARSVDDALNLIDKGWIPLAGSTALGRVKRPKFKLVDITSLPFNFIEENERWIFIGALLTIEEVKKSLRGFVPLAEGISAHSCYSIRSMATIGGAIATAFPYSDLVPPLLVLDAEVSLIGSQGKVWVRLEEFLKRRRELLKGKLIKGVRISRELEEVEGFYKKLAYTSFDYALLDVAFCRYRDEIRVAVGSRPGAPKRLREFERDMDIEGALQEASLGDCSRVSAWWRREALKAILEDILRR